MNVYFVLSEMLSVTIPILDDGSGPKEDYAICELVATTSRSRAKWLAWKGDKDSFTGDMLDMPRFAVRQIAKDYPIGEGVLSNDPEFCGAIKEDLWAKVPDIVSYPRPHPTRVHIE